jgi:hypothetical protein
MSLYLQSYFLQQLLFTIAFVLYAKTLINLHLYLPPLLGGFERHPEPSMTPHIEQYVGAKMKHQIPSNKVQKYDLIRAKDIGSDS